jgi:hypothetical protein
LFSEGVATRALPLVSVEKSGNRDETEGKREKDGERAESQRAEYLSIRKFLRTFANCDSKDVWKNMFKIEK